MGKEIIIALGLIMGYILFRAIIRKQKSTANINSEHAQNSAISDVLSDDKYKVKGQWDK